MLVFKQLFAFFEVRCSIRAGCLIFKILKSFKVRLEWLRPRYLANALSQRWQHSGRTRHGWDWKSRWSRISKSRHQKSFEKYWSSQNFSVQDEKVWDQQTDMIKDIFPMLCFWDVSFLYCKSKKKSFKHCLTPTNLITVSFTTKKYVKSHETALKEMILRNIIQASFQLI